MRKESKREIKIEEKRRPEYLQVHICNNCFAKDERRRDGKQM